MLRCLYFEAYRHLFSVRGHLAKLWWHYFEEDRNKIQVNKFQNFILSTFENITIFRPLGYSCIPSHGPWKVKSSSQATTFESLAFTVGGRSTAAVLLVYRPGSQQVSNLFFEELTRYLEVLALYKCQIVIAGDFNIHVEKNDDRDAARLLDLFASFDCTQHVHEPTHARGGTLSQAMMKPSSMWVLIQLE